MISYGFSRMLDMGFDEAVRRTTEALGKEGFSIMTIIDVQQKFKEKLGVEFGKYLILGACSPRHAYNAILAEENIGLMLPCNVVLFEKEGKVVLSVIKPSAAMSMIDNPKLAETARTVEESLKKVFDAI
jgi:uncharacterized protein (DUF302 family)